MYSTKKIILIWLLTPLMAFGAFYSKEVKAQLSSDSTGTGAYFSHLNYGARNVALANTQVSDAYSLEGIYTNPAAFLFSENRTGFSTNFSYNHFHNVASENLNAVLVRNNRQFLAFGTSFHHNSPAGFTPMRPKAPVYFSQIGTSVFYAKMLTQTLSIGGGLNGVYGYTEKDWNWGITSNVGLFYAPSSSVSYGLAYSGVGGGFENLGARLRYSTVEESPGEGEEISSTALLIDRVPHRLELGATFRFPSMSKHPDFKISFANEKIFNEPGLIYKVGLEIFPEQLFAIRGGYILSPYMNGLRLGLGLLVGNMAVDYSFAEKTIGVEGYSHQLSISIGLSTTDQ